MNYSETIDYLFSMLPMYQRVGPVAFKKDLTNTLRLCEHLENPHQKVKTIHIAGTNGKGSVAHMLAGILQTSGLKVGLYTSPHLKDFRERIKINGEMISSDEVINFVEDNKTAFETIEPSFFEMTVCMAFDHFYKNQTDISIIETGLGGRFDSTNVIVPEISIITNIGLDHTQFLGETKEEIAFEKAGIIKEGVPVVIGESNSQTDQVFEKISQKRDATIYFADKNFSVKNVQIEDAEITLDLYKLGKPYLDKAILGICGKYQVNNFVTTIQSIELLKQFNITEDHIRQGANNFSNNTGFQGRWQKISDTPLTICDTGHNHDGLSEVLDQINSMPYKKLHFVYGTVNDKDIDSALNLLPKDASYYFCKAKIPRALDASILKNKAAEIGLVGSSFSTVDEAYKTAKENASKDDLVFVGGSTFVVAEVL
ncbi:MAG: bifunctional folylpolyglutamate synthase/dihydrofolate synthase [Bacteroidia bacterium]|nr:bifunctional folylpolyglutamate synthase/dihydrofolate synthase [Bacteroidia bacterium]